MFSNKSIEAKQNQINEIQNSLDVLLNSLKVLLECFSYVTKQKQPVLKNKKNQLTFLATVAGVACLTSGITALTTHNNITKTVLGGVSTTTLVMSLLTVKKARQIPKMEDKKLWDLGLHPKYFLRVKKIAKSFECKFPQTLIELKRIIYKLKSHEKILRDKILQLQDEIKQEQAKLDHLAKTSPTMAWFLLKNIPFQNGSNQIQSVVPILK